MIAGSTIELSFIQIAAGLPGLGMRDLLADMLADAVAQRQRRDRHFFQFCWLGIAGDVVEDARDVARDHRIGGEEGESV